MAVRAVSADVVRDGVRTPHPGTVLVLLLILGVMLLGIYEAFAALVRPEASILLPLLGMAGG
ncbi:MAG: hypothetical protein QOF51_2181 [Chloroflexota bacterium]|nr:hypothetical protein [Chloroflexota bacterium]